MTGTRGIIKSNLAGKQLDFWSPEYVAERGQEPRSNTVEYYLGIKVNEFVKGSLVLMGSFSPTSTGVGTLHRLLLFIFISRCRPKIPGQGSMPRCFHLLVRPSPFYLPEPRRVYCEHIVHYRIAIVTT